MKPTTIFVLLMISIVLIPGFCLKADTQSPVIPDPVIKEVAGQLKAKCDKADPPAADIERAVRQTAALWRASDGTPEQFKAFCAKHFITSAKVKKQVFEKLSRAYEVMWGNYNKISLQLQEPMHLDIGELHHVDTIFGGHDPFAHFNSDCYANKVAFINVLNFPFYSLEEKSKLGAGWNRLQWAYARMGDVFTSRVPANLRQDFNQAKTGGEIYISQYNIYMDQVLNKKGKTLYKKKTKLLTHWNLRDELKAQYGLKGGIAKQQLLYDVMNRIITQDVPVNVIDNDKFQWNPYKNKVFQNGKEVEYKPENTTRYQHILNVFHSVKAMDKYYPAGMETYVKRSFAGSMEIMQPEVEELFARFLKSPQVKKVARLIKKRLGRKLKPWDIWYSGFMSRSGIPESKLDEIVKKKYPNAAAMEKDLESILLKLKFSPKKAKFLASKIVVDDARGSGHAWGPQMKSEKSHLRTRVPDDGMNYKGYNIAVHEFGHNVEQTISLNDVDYYIMQGVPNNSFTEALAFIFQRRDLELLGQDETNPLKKHIITLDTFWSMYESMGVSLVDMRIWKWLYKNPNADAAQLKAAVIKISKDTWNEFYAPVFGKKDEAILGVYSHMVFYPLYLSYYSYGQIIDFQVEQHLKGKDFGKEIERIYSAGTLVPNQWMQNAVGSDISIKPILKATDEALKYVKK